jgi:hypothetical protein
MNQLSERDVVDFVICLFNPGSRASKQQKASLRTEIALFLEYLIAHSFLETAAVFSAIAVSKKHIPSDTSAV